MESLPILPSTNGSSLKIRILMDTSDLEVVTSKGRVKPVKGTNFIKRNIQLVCRKKEEDFASLFLTDIEIKRLEEILNDDKKSKRNQGDNLNIIVNPYRLSKQGELTVREIDLKLQILNPSIIVTRPEVISPLHTKSKQTPKAAGTDIKSLNKKDMENLRELDKTLTKMRVAEKGPINPAPENVIQRLVQNCQSSTIHNKEMRRAQHKLPKRPASTEPMTKQAHSIMSPIHRIPVDIMYSLLVDTQVRLPSFQYRFPRNN